MGTISPLEKKPKNKCRKWRLFVSCGTDTNGKRIQRSKRVQGTYSEARDEMIKFEAECIGLTSRDVTFAEFCDDFLRRRKPLIAPTTYKTRESAVKTLKAIFGEKRKLSEMTSYTIERKLNGMLEEGLSGKPCKPTYVAGLYSTLSSIMMDAVRLSIIAKNPVDGIPRPNGKPKEKHALTIEEAHKLIDLLDPTVPNEMCILLNLTLGLRRGEALGVKWGDINLTDKTIYIQRNLRTDGTLADTKTEAGKRIMPLPDFLINKLALRRMAQELGFKRSITAGLMDEMPDMDDVLICANELNVTLRPSSMTVWWKNHRAALGCPHVTEHELRHTFATNLARIGTHPSVMQKLLGHTKSDMTLEIYTHVNMPEKNAAMDSMTEALGM